MSLLIYINDELIDLYPNTVFAYTYQNTLINSLTTRRVSYSNSFSIPFTNTNTRIYGNAHKVESTTNVPYSLASIRVIQNGYEIVTNGKVVLKKSKNGYDLEIYTGIVNFIDSLSDETIDQLYEIDTNLVTWNASTIDSKRAATSGLVAPFMSYGQLGLPSVLKNRDFSAALDITNWLQSTDGTYGSVDWAVASGFATCKVVASSPALPQFEVGYSGKLTQAYKFYKDANYTITITGYKDTASVYTNIFILGDVEYPTSLNFDGLLGAVDFDTVNDTFSFSFTADQNYNYVSIVCNITQPAADSDIEFYVDEFQIETILSIGEIYLPSVYYKSIFSNLVTTKGYDLTLSDGISANTAYDGMVVPFSKDNLLYSGFFNDCREFEAILTGNQTITADGAVIFNSITKKDFFGFYNPTTGVYDQAGSYQQTVTPDTRAFYSRFFCEMVIQVVSGTAQISISAENATLDLVSTTLGGTGVYNVNLAVTNYANNSEGYSVEAGDNVRVYVNLTGVGAEVRILSGRFYNEVNGLNREDTPRFYAAEILPSIKKKDFFKDFCVRFGIIPKETDQRELVLKTINEVLNDRLNALDWTGKQDKNFIDEIIYVDSKLAQNNLLIYPSNDELFSDSFGRGNLKVENENINIEQEFYKSIYNGTQDFTFGDVNYIYAGFVPVWDAPPTEYPTVDGIKFDNAPGNRLLMTRAKLSNEGSVYYNGTLRSDYKVANFIASGTDYLGFSGFLRDNYSFLIEALKQNKIITRYYYLTDSDIAAIDPHKLIYDSGFYYYLNKVSDYVSGKVTKVELLKV